MPTYSFTSPGAAAGQAMQDVLTQRREEARQRLLDEIAAKDAESTRAARAAQVKATEESVLASQAQREKERLAIATEGLKPGADAPPGFEEAFQKAGLMVAPSIEETPAEPLPFQTPLVGEEVQGIEGLLDIGQPVKPEAKRGGYRGTEEQQDKARRVEQAKKVFGVFQDTAASKPEKTAALIQAILESGDIPAGGFAPILASPEPPKGRFAFDPVNKKSIPMLDPSGRQITTEEDVMELSYPPRGPAESPLIFLFEDPDTKRPVYRMGNKPVISDDSGNFVEYRGKAGVKPTAASVRAFRVPASLAIDYADALRTLEQGKGMLWNRAGKKEDVAAANALKQQIINYAKLPTVKEAIRKTLDIPELAKEDVYIMANDFMEDGIFTTQQEKDEFVDVMSGVRGK